MASRLERSCELGLVVVHELLVHTNYKSLAELQRLQYRTGAGVADDDVRRAHLFRYCRREAEPCDTAGVGRRGAAADLEPQLVEAQLF